MSDQGFFSVLRWRADATRDEARNVAVILVSPDGEFGGVKAAPLSSVSPRLHDQGILDDVIAGLEQQFSAPHKPGLVALEEWHRSMQHSLCLTEPRPTAVSDADVVLQALYRAYVQPRGHGSSVLTKGRLLDQIVGRVRRRGFEVRRGTYVDDYLFDAVVHGPGVSSAVEVLSFATSARSWASVEHDAGHFLYALGRVNLSGLAVVQAPTDGSQTAATQSWERVNRWFREAGLRVLAPAGVEGYFVNAGQLGLGS